MSDENDINLLGIKNYVESARVRAEHAKPLARELANAAPADADEGERKALARIVRCSDDVESVLRQRERISAERLRDLRARFATQWGALDSVLSGSRRSRRVRVTAGPRPRRCTRCSSPMGWASSRSSRRLRGAWPIAASARSPSRAGARSSRRS